MEAAVLYAGFRSIGLEYGPAFQALDIMWMTSSGAEAAGSLRRRSDMQGMQAHPGDLDSALQHTVLLFAQSSSANETRLPFSVAQANMKSAQQQLTSVRHALELRTIGTTQR